MTYLPINKKIFALAILLAGLFIGLAIVQVHAAANDSSITLKKDPSTGLFTLTVTDPDGIQEFSITPVGKYSYGGGLSQCPKTFSINNVAFQDPADFTPSMAGDVIDCANNTANLQILPPTGGVAKSKSVVKEEAPLPPAAPAETPKSEPAGSPLSASNIQYPVPELGGCGSEAACRTYCDNSQHAEECFAFAKQHNLVSDKEYKDEEKEFFDVKNGPGGCNSGPSCEAYCNNVDHLDACIAFAEKSGYYSGDKLAEAKKFQELAKSGKQFPGGCKDRNVCELYCNNPSHMEECLNFAEESGFMPKEEIEQARKILPLMQRGETPGGCTSKEQCEKYCFEESHSDECIAFGEKAGLISSEDAAMIKKTGGKGPGGCRSKEQCESYCENNGDTCFQWAQENGFFSEADLAKMKKGLSQFKEQLDKVPPEVVQCLKDAVGEKNFNKLINGQPIFDRSLEGKMKSCFSQITSQLTQQLNTIPPEASQCIKDAIGEEGLNKLKSGEFDEDVDFQSLEGCFQKLQQSFGGGPGGPGGPGGFSGPGGCKSIDECTSYCQSNPKECQQFAPPGGGGFSGGGGEEHNGLAECGITNGAVAEYVCGINGRGSQAGVETTYFNECHAKQHGAQIVHGGVCVRGGGPDKPCSDIATPVCGTDGVNYIAACYATEHKAGVKHEGVCTREDAPQQNYTPTQGSPTSPEDYCQQHPDQCGGQYNQTQPQSAPQNQTDYQKYQQPPANYGGPGGCRSADECKAYCTANYQDPACSGFKPPSSDAGDRPFFSRLIDVFLGLFW